LPRAPRGNSVRDTDPHAKAMRGPARPELFSNPRGTIGPPYRLLERNASRRGKSGDLHRMTIRINPGPKPFFKLLEPQERQRAMLLHDGARVKRIRCRRQIPSMPRFSVPSIEDFPKLRWIHPNPRISSIFREQPSSSSMEDRRGGSCRDSRLPTRRVRRLGRRPRPPFPPSVLGKNPLGRETREGAAAGGAAAAA